MKNTMDSFVNERSMFCCEGLNLLKTLKYWSLRNIKIYSNFPIVVDFLLIFGRIVGSVRVIVPVL